VLEVESNSVRIKITGMSCNHCKKAVEDALMEISGVEKAVVSLEEGIADVTCKENAVKVEDLKKAIEEAGYTAE
jgi:copper chaperone